MKFPKPKRKSDDLVMEHYRQGQCVVCGRKEVDPCHIRSRGAGGPDEEFNLIRMCREHHQAQHKLGWITFIKKNPVVGMALKAKGWQISGDEGMWHPKLSSEVLDGDS